MQDFTKLVFEGESLEDLDGKKIIQHKDKYRFTSDAVLLANFVKLKKGERVCEFCAGSGVISLLLSDADVQILALELQPYMAELAQRNVKINDLQHKIQVFCADVNNADSVVEAGSVNVVVCNPPYRKLKSGQVSQNLDIAIARHELYLSLEGMIAAAKRVLKFGGRLYFIHQSQRMIECIDTLKKHNLEPKSIRMVFPKACACAHLFLCEAVLGGKSGLIVDSPLVLNI